MFFQKSIYYRSQHHCTYLVLSFLIAMFKPLNAKASDPSGALSFCHKTLHPISRDIVLDKSFLDSSGQGFRKDAGWYAFRRLRAELKNLGENYILFMNDIGVLSHYKEAYQELLRLKVRNQLLQDPLIAKNHLRQALGSATYFRSFGVLRSNFSLDSLKSGHFSPLVFDNLAEEPPRSALLPGETLDAVESLMGPRLLSFPPSVLEAIQDLVLNGYQGALSKRFGHTKEDRSRLRSNPMISISEFPESALGIAKMFARKPFDSLLLLKLKLPSIDVINLSRNPYYKYPFYVRLGLKARDVYHIFEFDDGRRNSHFYDERQEGFTFLGVERSEIEEVYLVPHDFWGLRFTTVWQNNYTPEEQVSHEEFMMKLQPYKLPL